VPFWFGWTWQVPVVQLASLHGSEVVQGAQSIPLSPQ
jgi:hypothetical protein